MHTADTSPQGAFQLRSVLNTAVIVAALGYFVDIYDLILFSIVRVPSLTSFGLVGDQVVDKGILLINMQMYGMLVGGLFWGVLGDKRGRLAILFGSIITYSLANVANGFATSVEQYAALRFIAGVGLAGELGAGITLVVEVMPKESRGWGTMVVAGIGLLGAIAANLTVKLFDWRTAYFIGGGLGFLLLLLRFSVYESGMFSQVKDSSVSRGNFFLVFSSGERFLKYLRCVVVGIPLWFVVGILVTFSPEIGKAMGIASGVSGGDAVMYCYAGIATGDFITGWLSQRLRSRVRVLLVSLIATSLMIILYFYASQLFGAAPSSIYIVAYLLGVACGYWAIFVTVAAEQFGTNVRATVTTTVPNFVRGSVPLLTFAFRGFGAQLGIVQGTALLGAIVMSAAMLSLVGMQETFGKDLDYVEH
jgi:MFS transporter, putative metabolite:H+ symporter